MGMDTYHKSFSTSRTDSTCEHNFQAVAGANPLVLYCSKCGEIDDTSVPRLHAAGQAGEKSYKFTIKYPATMPPKKLSQLQAEFDALVAKLDEYIGIIPAQQASPSLPAPTSPATSRPPIEPEQQPAPHAAADVKREKTGSLVRQVRQQLHETQAQFGKRFGVRQVVVSWWENHGVKLRPDVLAFIRDHTVAPEAPQEP
jgi:DNA-binding XRE family transcriptional regulator